jgi:hypothetical protein
MEFLRSFFKSKEYKPWQGRNLESTHSHYQKRYIPEAMKILFEARGDIGIAINEYCDTINRQFLEGIPPRSFNNQEWEDILAEKLIGKFIADHQKRRAVFKNNILNVYPKASLFFGDLNDLLNNDNYPNNLKRVGTEPIIREGLNIGWIAIIREFGLFGVTGYRFDAIATQILDNPVRKICAEEIIEITNLKLDRKSFENGDIICPAQNQVRNHFGLCVALNFGLMKNRMYNPKKRISLLENGSTHFKSTQAMIEEFKNKNLN